MSSAPKRYVGWSSRPDCGAARIRKKGGRVYELLEPGAPVDIPSEFSQVYEHLQVAEKMTNQDLRKMLKCDRHQAYRQARHWVEMGFLERKGGGRGVYYVIGPRLR